MVSPEAAVGCVTPPADSQVVTGGPACRWVSVIHFRDSFDSHPDEIPAQRQATLSASAGASAGTPGPLPGV